MDDEDRRIFYNKQPFIKIFCEGQFPLQQEIKGKYSVSQKNPPWGYDIFYFFINGWEFLVNFLNTYYTFLSSLDYKFLFNYIQLWRSYAILSATT